MAGAHDGSGGSPVTEALNAEDVSGVAMRLVGEDVLVKTIPAETERASGLHLQHSPTENLLGDVYYGEVVAVGPGRQVVRGPTLDECVAAVYAAPLYEDERIEQAIAVDVAEALAPLFSRQVTVPTQWKPGDRVVLRQGFAVELLLREGVHHIASRVALKAKGGTWVDLHGVVCAWDPNHVHCWHLEDHGERQCREHDILGCPNDDCWRDTSPSAACCHVDCPTPRTWDMKAFEPYPRCLHAGPRLAETVVGVPVQANKLPSAPKDTEGLEGLARDGEGWRGRLGVEVPTEVTGTDKEIADFMDAAPRTEGEVRDFRAWLNARKTT